MFENLLIVDDEYEIRLGLEEMFKYDFEEKIDVYTASSAYEALELLNKIRFEVVLTDIKMPGMDGITLFEHIKENWPRCKTVFLTGYRNFDDMYRVINHKDVRYVLKSEEDEVIMGAVQDALEESRRELESEKTDQEQEKFMERATFWMQKSLIDQLVSGKIHENNFEEKLKQLQLDFLIEHPFLLYCIRIDETEEPFLNECLEQIIKKNMPGKIKYHFHMIDHQYSVLFLQPQDVESLDWEHTFVVTRGAIEYVQEIFKNTYHSLLSAVLWQGPITHEECAQQIRMMRLYMMYFLGENKGALRYLEKQEWIELREKERGGDQETVVHSISHLRSLLEMRKKKEFFLVIWNCLEIMKQKSSQHDSTALEIYYSLAVALLQFINEKRLQEQLAFKVALYKLTKADAHENWEEATKYILDVSEAIFSVLDVNEASVTDRALQRVITYIDEHLSEELSLTTLAEEGGFNASYLSRLFRQVKQQTISEYILQKRMQLATDLLIQTNEKIQDIASKTGYISAHSFGRAFRKEFGISPKEYRELKNGEKREA